MEHKEKKMRGEERRGEKRREEKRREEKRREENAVLTLKNVYGATVTQSCEVSEQSCSIIKIH
jgi:hypothetical protein